MWINLLYIFWFLHQTTTTIGLFSFWNCCISFDSYIKPQPGGREKRCSNSCISFDSYIKPQPSIPMSWHKICCISFDSYIKPQPHGAKVRNLCVVYLLIPTSNHNWRWGLHVNTFVVYLLIPTSNHNCYLLSTIIEWVVYLLIPTSNHNLQIWTYWFSAHNKPSI